jgi:2-methylcitrate dehydratase PrpD
MTHISGSLVRFALSGDPSVPDRLRAAVSDLTGVAAPYEYLDALRSAYPEGDLRVRALENAAGLAHAGVRPLVAATAAVARIRQDTNAECVVVRGCEVACRLAAALNVDPDDLPVVSAALAGSVEYDAGLHALGLAAAQVTAVRGASEGHDATVLRTALAAVDGIEAALLGERGFTAPQRPIEGRRGVLALLAPEAEAEELLRDLGTRWLAEETLLPSVRSTGR